MKLNINKKLKRIIIVSYRLPFSIIEENGKKILRQNTGGLVSAILGLSSKIQSMNSESFTSKIQWFGYSEHTKEEFDSVEGQSDSFDIFPVNIPSEINKNYYEGFCNDTIWPLFHYFPTITEFENSYYDDYKKANQIFYDTISPLILQGDYVWVHDYQLMLLPGMIREKFIDLSIGFFLHISFPSFEIFMLLHRQWREEIIEGLLGADLIGFHTNDYSRNFINSVSRIRGYEIKMHYVITKRRIVKVDTFPIGIDYDKFSNDAQSERTQNEIKEIRKYIPKSKLIFSVDRLDYTKGLLNRLIGYERFLEDYPEWKEKVVFNMVVVPSRDSIPRYQEMKKEIEAAVGRIQGKFSNLSWKPIVYQYKSLEYFELLALYSTSDVGMITPLRDGMNLVSKEYLACQNSNEGILILSEMAGASAELGEAILVNPNDANELAEAIHQALTMSPDEIRERVSRMRIRINKYNVFAWAFDFINQLTLIKEEHTMLEIKVMTEIIERQIIEKYKNSMKRIIFLDYDGTMVPFSAIPENATPGVNVLELIKKLSGDTNNEIVIISGRKRIFLDKWFSDCNVNLVAEHGLFMRRKGQDWELKKDIIIDKEIKQNISEIMEKYTDRCHGSFIEEKEAAVVWHFRNADPELAFVRSQELKSELFDMINYYSGLQLLEGNKVIEVKKAGFNKGTSVNDFIQNSDYDFILALGDDVTDEDMFQVLPDRAVSIKIGKTQTYAKYNIVFQELVHNFLEGLIKNG
ncbi:MAG: bifunctional alpha,alpha-trehalose-phosphate synthase (UDP-forming)/trehalose-phosphatase [Leptospiraceae bacterium]|nr:bifunctional alpha,alpha-trehalose-phosphate synthase (UDP-forming)/trehalose-phosphatase [Leptospiraceae bacterium]MCP5512274.1 bifunctional alpha,alpha-trehalose-phosphate synthase (UDP-forming)/trehalose-phosphatase [Leptospiraceae bacterium]